MSEEPAVVVQPVSAAELDPDQVLDLYRSVGWTAYSDHPPVLQAALTGSSHLAAAFGDGRLVGMARVISDGASIAYLQDVLVHPKHHRHGLGSALVHAVLAPCTGVRQTVLLTDDHPALAAFYASLGFTEVGHGNAQRLRAFTLQHS